MHLQFIISISNHQCYEQEHYNPNTKNTRTTNGGRCILCWPHNPSKYFVILFVEKLHNAPKASPTLTCINCAEMRRMKASTSQGCSSKWWTGIRDQSHSSALNAHCKKPSQVSTQPIENVWFSLQRSTLWVQTVNPTIYDKIVLKFWPWLIIIWPQLIKLVIYLHISPSRNCFKF